MHILGRTLAILYDIPRKSLREGRLTLGVGKTLAGPRGYYASKKSAILKGEEAFEHIPLWIDLSQRGFLTLLGQIHGFRGEGVGTSVVVGDSREYLTNSFRTTLREENCL